MEMKGALTLPSSSFLKKFTKEMFLRWQFVGNFRQIILDKSINKSSYLGKPVTLQETL
jgi:hypothetical protein